MNIKNERRAGLVEGKLRKRESVCAHAHTFVG